MESKSLFSFSLCIKSWEANQRASFVRASEILGIAQLLLYFGRDLGCLESELKFGKPGESSESKSLLELLEQAGK